jgi:hypothetical protein
MATMLNCTEGLSACVEGIMRNGLNLPILHGFRHFYFSIIRHSCRFCLLLRTWTMLRPTSYFKTYICSTFSLLFRAASTRWQLWLALLGSPFSSLGAITGTQCWLTSTIMPSVWREEPCPLGWDLRASPTVLSV